MSWMRDLADRDQSYGFLEPTSDWKLAMLTVILGGWTSAVKVVGTAQQQASSVDELSKISVS